MAPVANRPSTSVEDYVKVIYDLQERGSGPVTISRVAERLAVSNSSVSGMLRKLGELGLVDHQRYGDVRLTPTGDKVALAVLRRHRLIELYLVEELGYSWDEVHDEAEQLEHSVSDELAQRIDDFLGNPQFDPHGDPIPTADGQVFHRESTPLSEVEPPAKVRVVRVLDQQPDVLRHLTRLGLTPNAELEIVEVLSFDGQMTVRIGEKEATVSRTLASRLLVAPA